MHACGVEFWEVGVGCCCSMEPEMLLVSGKKAGNACRNITALLQRCTALNVKLHTVCRAVFFFFQVPTVFAFSCDCRKVRSIFL